MLAAVDGAVAAVAKHWKGKNTKQLKAPGYCETKDAT